MNYYLIGQDSRARNAVKVTMGRKSEIWKSDAPCFMPVKVNDMSQYPYFLPLLEGSEYLVSDPVKKIFEVYQIRTLYRPCVLGLVEKKIVRVYWMMQPRILDCLEERIKDRVIYSAEDIVLSREKIGYNKVFRIDTIAGNYLVIDEEVLEQLMRAGLSAVSWTGLQAV